MKNENSFSRNRVSVTLKIKEKMKGDDMAILNIATIAGFFNNPVEQMRWNSYPQPIELHWCSFNPKFNSLEYADIVKAVERAESIKRGSHHESPLCVVAGSRYLDGEEFAEFFIADFQYPNEEDEDYMEDDEGYPVATALLIGDKNRNDSKNEANYSTFCFKTSKFREVTFIHDIVVTEVDGETKTVLLLQKKLFPIFEKAGFEQLSDWDGLQLFEGQVADELQRLNELAVDPTRCCPEWTNIKDLLVLKGDIRDYYAKLTNEHLAEKIAEIPNDKFEPLREAVQAQMIGNGYDE